MTIGKHDTVPWVAGSAAGVATLATLITMIVVASLALQGHIAGSTSGYVLAGLAGGGALLAIGSIALTCPRHIKRSSKDDIFGPKFIVVTRVWGPILALAVTIGFVVMGILAGRGILPSDVFAKVTLGVYGGVLGLTLIALAYSGVSMMIRREVAKATAG